MPARILQLFVSWLLLASSLALAEPGDVDPTFVYPRPTVLEPDSTNAIPLANGFLVIKSRNFDTAGTNSTVEVTRIDEDGHVVPTFGIGGTVTITLPGAVNVSSAAKGLPDGSMLLAGFQRVAGAIPDNVAAVVRLDATGRVDSSFGLGGIATFDVPGQVDRIGAIDVLADGRILAGVWSRMQADPYGDCSTDRVSLVRLNPDGTGPEVIYYREKNRFADNGCRNVMTLQVLPDQRFYFGSHVEIVVFDSPESTGWRAVRPLGCCYGPFGFDDRLGAVWSQQFFGGPSLDWERFPFYYDDIPGDAARDLSGELTYTGFPTPRTASVLVPAGDPPSWYLGFSSDGGVAGIAKLLANGQLDSGWAQGAGLVRIDGTGRLVPPASEGLANDIRMISVRPGRGTLVVATADGVIERRFATSGPAHGRILFGSGNYSVPEAAGSVQIPVIRTGGTDGAVSVQYTVGPLATDCQVDACATSGEDFVPSTGRLDWADGDGTDRTITVQIINDVKHEHVETFSVDLSAPSGGAVIAGYPSLAVDIVDDDPAASSATDSGNSKGGGSGGGGATGAATLCVLFLAIAARLYRSRPRALSVHRACVALTAIPMLLPTPVNAEGAPGDVDPTFVYPRPTVLEPDSTNAIALPNGFIVVKSRPADSAATSSTLALTLVDEDGRLLTDQFGRDGTVTNEIPGAVNVSTAASRALNGTMLFGGYQRIAGSAGDSIAAVVRVDSTGHLDPSFGVNGLATFDVQGDLDRVVGVGALDDGRVAVLVWSRMESIYYDCDYHDRTTLVLISPDGRGIDVQAVSERNAYATESCRTTVTLQVLPGSSIVYGNEVGIWNGTGGSLTGINWRYGPFSWVPNRGLYYSTVQGSGIDVLAPNAPIRNSTGQFRSVGWAVGYSGPITWNPMAVDDSRAVVFVGFSNDGGQAGVARFLNDGSIDTSWSDDGLAPIEGSGRADAEPADYGPATDVRMLTIRANGDLVVATADGILQRFMGGAAPAHGALIMTSSQVTPESGKRILVQVNREGGSAGPINVDYTVDSCEAILGGSCASDQWLRPATAGVDFKQQSGRLDWSDGDSSPRVIAVEIYDDNEQEPEEYFMIRLSNPTGGATIVTAPLNLVISASDAPTTTPTPATGSTSGGSGTGSSSGSRSGGGGATSWSFLALVAGCLLLRRRGTARLPRSRLLIALALTALAAETHVAQARIGDMDPNYADGGQFRARDHGSYSLFPPLADGRLFYFVSGGYQRTDTSGHPDESFGPGGVRAWPANCNPQAWLRIRDGRLVAAGRNLTEPQNQFSLIRFQMDGEPDASFGRDGVIDIAGPPSGPGLGSWDVVGVEEQPDGRLLVLLGHQDGYPVDYDDEYDRYVLIRTLSDGTPDSSFGSGGSVELGVSPGYGFAVLADGRIVVGSVYLTDRGEPTTGAPVEGTLPESKTHNWTVAARLSGGGEILVAERSDAGGTEPYKLAKRRADGTVDNSFGTDGTGVSTLSFLPQDLAWFGASDVSADGRYFYLSGYSEKRGFIALRVYLIGPQAGTPDTNFGPDGLGPFGQCSQCNFQGIHGLADGSAIVYGVDYAFRLLGENTASPGFVGFRGYPCCFDESAAPGPLVLRVFRAAGKDGVLRVHYSTEAVVDDSGNVHYAIPGVDYEPVSGELVWDDGDDSDKVIFIRIIPDTITEGTEQIRVTLSSPSLGSWILGSGAINAAISDPPQPPSTPSATPPPVTSPGSGHSGGGGYGGLTLLCLLAAARRLAVTARNAS